MVYTTATGMIAALLISCTGYADYDVEFLSNEKNSGYTIVITDEYDVKTKVDMTEKEFLYLIDDSTAQDKLVNKILKSIKNTGF